MRIEHRVKYRVTDIILHLSNKYFAHAYVANDFRSVKRLYEFYIIKISGAETHCNFHDYKFIQLHRLLRCKQMWICVPQLFINFTYFVAQ